MTYFVTGGTGSFGAAFTAYVIEQTSDNIVVYSRDEMKPNGAEV